MRTYHFNAPTGTLHPMRTLFSTSLLLSFLLMGGCQTPALEDLSLKPKAPPPTYLPENTFSVDFLPNDFAKVAVLPIHHDLESGADTVAYMAGTFVNELNSKSQLEAVTLSGSAMQRLAGEPSVSSISVLPADLLAQIRSETGVDGVLFTDLTHYYPYNPISIGVRCKLADAVTGEILWSADSVYHAGSQQTQAAALYFQKQQSGSQFPLQDSGVILQSPRYFSRFVASTLLDTLPRR